MALNFGDYEVIIIIIIIIIIITIIIIIIIVIIFSLQELLPQAMCVFYPNLFFFSGHNRKSFLKVTSYQTLLISTSAVKD